LVIVRLRSFNDIVLALMLLLCTAAAAHAEVLNWNYPSANTNIIGASSTTTVNGVSITTSDVATGSFTSNVVNIEPASSLNGSSVGIINPQMDATVDDGSVFNTVTVRFSEPVYNVSFSVLDIDGGPNYAGQWNDIVDFGSSSGAFPTAVITNTAWVAYNGATGRATAISNQNAVNGNANQANGTIRVTYAGPVTAVTIRHIAGPVNNPNVAGDETNPAGQVIAIDDITFTRSPRLTLTKTSLNGVGTFGFANSNGVTFTAPNTYVYGTTSTSIATVTSGVAVTGPSSILGVVNQVTNITETGASLYDITSSPVACSDSNNAVSGNPATFNATVSGYVVTLAAANVRAGAVISCSITNTRKATLTLVKNLVNNNNGPATLSSFTLTATGTTTISGTSGSTAVSSAPVTPGTYALSETNVAGYSASAWSCTAGTLSGSNLTLTSGQVATCTITNDDIGPVLTLVKTVTDTSGGPSTVPSFTLTAAGPVTISGITTAPAVTSATVSAGTYALSETGPAGYTAGAWSCTAGTLSGSNLTLALGQTATCTINNVRLPTLTLQKISNGGTGAFGFSGTNGVPTQTISTTAVGSTFTGSVATLTAAGVATNITETMPATFWEIQTAACTGMGTGGTATLSGNVLTLNAAATAAGRNITCTFTNRRRPTVSVQKITPGTPGGAFTFAATNLASAIAPITTTGTSAFPASPARQLAAVTGTAVSVTETSPLAWVASGVTCSDANSAVSGNTNPVATSTSGVVNIPATAVRVGADINCVFTNVNAAPQLSLNKTSSVASVSAALTTITYTLAVSNTGNTVLNSLTVTDPLGPVTCPVSGTNTIATLNPGASQNCTISYSVPQSVFDDNGGGDGDIDNTATAATTYNGSPVNASGSRAVLLTISPAMTVVKTANTAGPVNVGDTITYTYRVRNTGNVTISNVSVTDVHNGLGVAPVPGSEVMFTDVAPFGDSTDGAPAGIWGTLRPGDTIQFTATYNVVQADIDFRQ
jgi:large repetitive protein